MNQDTHNTVLITGANSGFGLATAALFAHQGWRVIAGVRRNDANHRDPLVRLSEKGRFPFEVVELDVASDESITRGMNKVYGLTKTIDVLINNAGFGFVGPLEDLTIDELKEQFETNFFGAVRMVHAVTPIMRNAGGGTIINIGSVNGLVSFPFYGAYSATKFALETVSEIWAFELAPFGIRVCIVEPGTFLTSFTDNRKHPGRMGSPDSPYSAVTTRFFANLVSVKKKLNGTQFNPDIVAKKLYSIANKKTVRLRYKVGFDSYLFHILDSFSPKSLKFAVMRHIYGWK